MKNFLKKNNKIVFRINLDIYPQSIVEKIFGKGKRVGKYIVFETDKSENEIYKGFDDLLEGMI